MQTDNDIEKRKTDGRNGIIFFLPFAYYFSIRLKTVPKLLSWLLLYLFPTGWYAYLCAGGFSLHFVLTYLLLLIAVFTLYETGYIHNDTYATRRETEPTLRLDEASQTFFYHHAGQIFGSRACIALLALTGFFLLNGRSAASWCTVASVMAVPVLFYAYNCWRSRYNVLLYPVLVFSRYLPFLLPWQPDLQYVLLLFLSFPCCLMLERFSMPRYRFAVMRRLIPDEKSKTRFRPAYYLLATFVLQFFFSPIELVPFFVLGIYRLAIALLVRYYTPRNYLGG